VLKNDHVLNFFRFPKKTILKKCFVISLIIVFIFSSIAPLFATTSNDTSTLEDVEIREYEGQDLSSINNFRENSISGPQHINIENYSLTVNGLVNNSLILTYDEVINSYPSYKKVVTLNCVEGWSAKILWEGIILKDLLAKAVVDPKATTVIFYANDGYSTSFPLDYIIDNNILMAYKMNNITIIPERGFPFVLVAESKWGYKWIKWITSINLSSNQEYKGFWESVGYSNDGDLSKSFFENYSEPGIPEFPSLSTLTIISFFVLMVMLFYRRNLKQNRKNK
jgi:DMSO/TMAO reductase YedYZ molybdopterin-dependent catalytic subunit